jgi:hypothetical protein
MLNIGKRNDPVDGFTHSLSTALLPTTYRALVLAQMETVRKATNYQFKMYSAPDAANANIPAFSQNEYKVRMRPGTLVWGWWVNATGGLSNSYVNVVDMSTGLGLTSDYELAYIISASNTSAKPRAFLRYPCLLSQPRLIAGDGSVIIEIYNSSATSNTYQLVLFCAEPLAPPQPCADPSEPCFKG